MNNLLLSEENKRIYEQIIKIMEIENDKETQYLLNEWIMQIGLDEVLMKVIKIYSTNLYD